MSATNPYQKVFELVHRPKRAAFLKGEGDSAAYRPQETITRADFLAHCRDEQCIALGCVNARGEALFLAWDIDRHFYRRLGALRAALDRRGWAEAALIVDGSGVGRGKVVLLLASPIPQDQAVGIAREVLADAAKHPMFGSYDSDDVTVFPKRDTGGEVRLFGRNRKRRGQGLCEAILDWDGDLLWSLDSIRPAAIEPDGITMVSAKPFHRQPRDVQALLSRPWTYRGKEGFAKLVRLAGAAVKTNDAQAEAVLANWVTGIEANSPGLSDRTRGTLLGFRSQARAIEYVRGNKVTRAERLGAWHPQSLPNSTPLPCRPSGTIVPRMCMVPKRALDAYGAMASYVIENNIDPHCLGITYGRIADLTGLPTKTVAQRAINEAESAGLLVRLDRGQPIKGGLCSLFSLVGSGETVRTATSIGIETDAFQQRIRDRAARDLSAPSIMQLRPET